MNGEIPTESDPKGKKPLYKAESSTLPYQRPQPVAWTKPPQDWFKLNIDGSFIESTGQGEAGAIARDWNGKVIFSVGVRIHGRGDAEEAEAHALLLGLRQLHDVYQGPVMAETDCAAVVGALASGEMNRSNCWALYEEICSARENFE